MMNEDRVKDRGPDLTTDGAQLEARLDRILTAIALGRPDRVPVVLEYAGLAAYLTQTPMAEFISSPARATRTMIDAYRLIGGGDAINYGSFSAYELSLSFGAKVHVPGFDLPPDEIWQVVESELMTRDDYDRILVDGWKAFFEEYLRDRVFNDADPDLLPSNQELIDLRSEWAGLGVPVLSGGDITTPFELLCGGRSLQKFFMDLMEIPETVEKVMAEILPHLSSSAITPAKEGGYPLVWVGGWRTAPCMISPPMWDRFVWPYLKHLIAEVIDSGLIPLLHLDSDWGRELGRFKEFEPGKIILALDGDTDIFEAGRVLKDRACLMGDVPASLLAFGSADEVREYCRKLIKELGPEGFILQSGCDIPANAKLENVQAMVGSVVD